MPVLRLKSQTHLKNDKNVPPDVEKRHANLENPDSNDEHPNSSRENPNSDDENPNSNLENCRPLIAEERRRQCFWMFYTEKNRGGKRISDENYG
jgi:hypothetical protein